MLFFFAHTIKVARDTRRYGHFCGVCANNTSKRESVKIQCLFSPPKYVHSDLSRTLLLYFFAPTSKIARDESRYLHFCDVCANNTSKRESVKIRFFFSPPKYAHSDLSRTLLLYFVAPTSKIARDESRYLHFCDVCANNTSKRESVKIRFFFSPPKYAHSDLSRTLLLYFFAPTSKIARDKSRYLHFCDMCANNTSKRESVNNTSKRESVKIPFLFSPPKYAHSDLSRTLLLYFFAPISKIARDASRYLHFCVVCIILVRERVSKYGAYFHHLNTPTATYPAPFCCIFSRLQAKLLVTQADIYIFVLSLLALSLALSLVRSLVRPLLRAHVSACMLQGAAARRAAFSARRTSCVFFLEKLRPRRGPHGLSGWTGFAHTCCLLPLFQ